MYVKKSCLGPSIFAELGRPVGLRSWAGLLGCACWFGIMGWLSGLRSEVRGQQADFDSDQEAQVT
jgi:hypothetical protein